MRHLIGILSLSLLLLGLDGCGYLLYPRADDYAMQAKGATPIETMINLTHMMETSAATAKGGTGTDQALDDYHNQLHALFDTFSQVSQEQRKTPAYDLAVTHKKKLTPIFWRLWKFRNDQPQRDQHLDVSITELKELRNTLQMIK